MSFSRPIQWYHSHADPIWPYGTFNVPVSGSNAKQSGLLSVFFLNKGNVSCHEFSLCYLARIDPLCFTTE